MSSILKDFKQSISDFKNHLADKMEPEIDVENIISMDDILIDTLQKQLQGNDDVVKNLKKTTMVLEAKVVEITDQKNKLYELVSKLQQQLETSERKYNEMENIYKEKLDSIRQELISVTSLNKAHENCLLEELDSINKLNEKYVRQHQISETKIAELNTTVEKITVELVQCQQDIIDKADLEKMADDYQNTLKEKKVLEKLMGCIKNTIASLRDKIQSIIDHNYSC
jgi:chromosome segregation ATPase